MKKLFMVLAIFFAYVSSAVAVGNNEVDARHIENAARYISTANNKLAPAVVADIVNAAAIASHGKLSAFITILAIAKKESRYTPSAVSQHGAVGVMQVMPKYHRDKIKNSDPKGIFANMIVGASVYEQCLSATRAKIQALQCYNGSRKTNTYANGVLAFERELLVALALGQKSALGPEVAMVQ